LLIWDTDRHLTVWKFHLSAFCFQLTQSRCFSFVVYVTDTMKLIVNDEFWIMCTDTDIFVAVNWRPWISRNWRSSAKYQPAIWGLYFCSFFLTQTGICMACWNSHIFKMGPVSAYRIGENTNLAKIDIAFLYIVLNVSLIENCLKYIFYILINSVYRA